MITMFVIARLLVALLFGAIAVFGIVFPVCQKKKGNETSETKGIPCEESNTIASEEESLSEEKDESFNQSEAKTDKGKHSGLKKLEIAYTISSFCFLILYGFLYIYVFDETDLFNAAKRLCLIAILFIAAFYDKKAFRIPNKLIIFGLGAWGTITILEFVSGQESFGPELLSSAIAIAALIVLSVVCLLITRKGIGMGDVKLFVLMGAFQGIIGVMSSMAATLLIAFVYGICLLVLKKKDRKDSIPFAPCILIGTLVSVALIGM